MPGPATGAMSVDRMYNWNQISSVRSAMSSPVRGAMSVEEMKLKNQLTNQMIHQTMKTINLFIAGIIALTLSTSCSGQSEKKEANKVASEAGNIEVVYFHNARRCATCNAVENVSSDAITENYGENIPFKGYNLEEAEGKKRAQELGVGGQALLIVKGDTKINITNEGFMYARSNPDKLKQVITEKINSLL